MDKIKIGTRRSALAVAQAEAVMRSIAEWDIRVPVELVTIPTIQDQYPELAKEVDGRAPYVWELEKALADGVIDLSVHSLKDMAAKRNPLLPVCAVSQREDPRDVLVLPSGVGRLLKGRPLGCSSVCRRYQLGKLFPGIQLKMVPGDVLSRLDRLDNGEFSGMVMSAADLKTLGLESRINRYFTAREMVPGCGQGFVAVQCRAGERVGYLANYHNANSWEISLAELAFSQTLGGGHSSPATAHAWIDGGQMTIRGYTVDRQGEKIPGMFSGPVKRAQKLGVELAAYLQAEANERG